MMSAGMFDEDNIWVLKKEKKNMNIASVILAP